MRGEALIAGFGYGGIRRQERVDVAELLGACVQIKDPESVLLDPNNVHDLMPPGFLVRDQMSASSLRIRAPQGDVILKLLPPVGSQGSWLQPSTRSYARRAHTFAHRLMAAGVGTPRVLGFADRQRRPTAGRSWLVTEYVRAPTLAHLRDAGVLDHEHEQKRCSISLAKCLSRLHTHQLFHGRVQAQSFLVLEREVLISDIESMVPGWHPQVPQQNFERLVHEFGHHLTRSTVVRFLKTYLGPVPDARLRRAALIDVVRRHTRGTIDVTTAPSRSSTLHP